MGCVRIQEYDILKLAGVVIWRQKVVGTAVFWFEKKEDLELYGRQFDSRN